MALGFILVPAGLYVQQWLARGTILHCTVVLVEGGLQVWWERRPGLQVTEVLIEASANIVVKAESVSVIAIRRRLSCGWGIALPFIGQGESNLQVCRTIPLRVEAWLAVPRG
jgi:hypothetical protein